ncbi:MAG: polysaccharide biosynthesis/export family protein [Terriglobia bacterium]
MAATKAKSAAERLVIRGKSACEVLLLLAIPSILFAQLPSSQSTAQNLQQLGQQAHPNRSSSTSLPSAGITIAPEGIAKLKLTPGSTISLSVFEESDIDGLYSLDDRGDISVPLAGTIHVGSLSLREAESAIRAKLIATGVLREAHVDVNLVQYAAQYVTVMGQVASPGQFPILAPRKLLDILALSGGLTPIAGNQIVIHRAGQPEQTTEIVNFQRNHGKISGLNVMINPGDSVLVKRAGIVYVLGAVNRPGGFVMQDDGSLNVVEALSLALGTADQAAIGHIKILRKKPDGTWLYFSVPLNKIQKGQAVPTVLRPEDIVYVPPSTLKEVGINIKAIMGGVGNAVVYRAP